jgi:vitamin B12 transporter
LAIALHFKGARACAPEFDFMKPAALYPLSVAPLALALAAALPLSARADDAKTLDRLIVTATRTPISVDDALAAVEVIDRAEIDASGAHSLPELLRGRAGITLVNQGGLGKLSTLFMRGTESDHTLVLVDGVRIGSPTSGLASLQDIPLALIDHIEIVRGPRSSLYGADAIGGVIQIFTRRGEGQGEQARARIAAGSHGLREASAGIDLRGARGGVGVEMAYQRTDGINACSGFYDPLTWQGAGCFIVPGTHLDRDGYRNRSASLRADFAPADGWQLDAHAFRAEGHNDYDGNYVDNSDIVQQVVAGSARWTPMQNVQLSLRLGRNLDDSRNYLGKVFSNRFATWRDNASLQGDIGMTEHQQLSVGFDWLRDAANVSNPWAPFSARRGNRGVFAQYLGEFGAADARQHVQFSLRHDDNDQFGGHTTGTLAWGMTLPAGWRVSASHGTAFKAPTFNELYYPGFSNPLLRPEVAHSSELELARSGAGWQVQANAYQTRVRDLIAYDAALGKPGNLDSARIRGLELTGEWQLDDWTARGQLGWLQTRNESAGANHGKTLPRRPGRSARLTLERRLGDVTVGVTGIAEAARWDNVANTLRVGGYGTLDARVAWRFAPGWTLQADIRNALDKRYETSAWYNQPGREYTLSLRWQPADAGR